MSSVCVCVCVCVLQFPRIYIGPEARSNVLGWGIMLQARESRVRF
jgi:hypothetical protein